MAETSNLDLSHYRQYLHIGPQYLWDEKEQCFQTRSMRAQESTDSVVACILKVFCESPLYVSLERLHRLFCLIKGREAGPTESAALKELFLIAFYPVSAELRLPTYCSFQYVWSKGGYAMAHYSEHLRWEFNNEYGIYTDKVLPVNKVPLCNLLDIKQKRCYPMLLAIIHGLNGKSLAIPELLRNPYLSKFSRNTVLKHAEDVSARYGLKTSLGRPAVLNSGCKIFYY